MDNFFIGHITDLSQKSEKSNIYTFSAFLTLEEQSEIIKNGKSLTSYTLFGGCETCERKVVRFGNEFDFGYSEDFPISAIEIKPVNDKFAENLSHRDILGAVMSLSVKRELIGDITENDGKYFVFVISRVADFICENLQKIKHTTVKCSVCGSENIEINTNIEEKNLTVSSLRADCIIGAVYNLSRNNVNTLFAAKKVFINSVQCQNISKSVIENDTVSVRGYGKFIFKKELSTTKKGRLRIVVGIYN